MKKIFHSLLNSAVVALLILPTSVWASIEDVTDNLMGPTEIITKLTVVASYIVGVGLVIFSIAQYREHRKSPKLVPLTTPIMLLILGTCALLIPYVSVISGESFSANEQAKREGKLPNKAGALAPMPEVKKKTLPGPGRYTPSDTQDSSSSATGDQDNTDYSDDEYNDGETNYDDGGNGHWTSDPRYR